MNRCMIKQLTQGLVALALVMGSCAGLSAASVTIQIQNSVPSMQIGATSYDGYKQPSINIWPPSSEGGGTTVESGSSYSYPAALKFGTSVQFGVQINAQRMPSLSAPCDQLCGHIQVIVSKDGKSCSAQNVSGPCASEQAPTWKLPSKLVAEVQANICIITIGSVTPSSNIACSCAWGNYPCSRGSSSYQGACTVVAPGSGHCTPIS